MAFGQGGRWSRPDAEWKTVRRAAVPPDHPKGRWASGWCCVVKPFLLKFCGCLCIGFPPPVEYFLKGKKLEFPRVFSGVGRLQKGWLQAARSEPLKKALPQGTSRFGRPALIRPSKPCLA